MVLVLNGVLQDHNIPPDSATLFLQHPVYRDTAAQLLSIPTKTIGPVGLLYVGQREMASVPVHDKQINFIGSDDATTCIIALIRHSGSGAVSLSHLDGNQVEVCVCQMIAKIQELSIGYPEGRIELQLVGGYRDTQGYGEELFFSIMQAFHKHPLEIDLTQAVVGDLNTVQRGEINWPVIYGIGINIKTGEIFPANFPDKGPDVQLRSARRITGGHSVLDIYDSQAGMIRIGPFNYEPMRGVDLWLSQTDEFLLQHLSTSPDVEPSHFACQLRSCLKYIQDNQFPSVTVFRDNHPHYFRRDETTGLWQRVPY